MGAEATTHVPEQFVDTTFQRRLRGREYRAGILPSSQLITPLLREEQYDRLASMVGHTPLLRMDGPNHSTVFIKVLSQNPTESHYDPAYLATLRRLEEDGVIRPGDELLEITSGSAGTSFAWLCSRLGYNAHILVPPELPTGRVQEMVNFGARVERSRPGYIPETAEQMRELVQEYRRDGFKIEKHVADGAYFVVTAVRGDERICLVNHSANRLTVDAFGDTAREVTDLIPKGVSIDFAISVLGNWTSTVGVSEVLRARFPSIQMVGLEDVRNPNYFAEKFPGEYEQRFGQEPTFGLHDSYGASARGTKLTFANVDLVDDIVLVDPVDRNKARERYNRDRAVIDTIGNTSASSLHVAEQIGEARPGSNILIFFYDKGDRYGEPVLVPAPGTTMSLLDAVPMKESAFYERRLTQPLAWRQRKPVSPIDVPVSLLQAYRMSA